MGSVAIENWCVAGTDLTWVVEDDDLSIERVGSPSVGRSWSHRQTFPRRTLLDGDVLDVETDVVTWNTLDELLVVHLNGLDFGGDVCGSESDDHTGLNDTSFDTT